MRIVVEVDNLVPLLFIAVVLVVITFHISSFSSVSRSRNIAASLGLVYSDVISSVVGFLWQLNR